MGSRKNKTGLIHVYTGDGKGKTTAALGLAVRAAGWGWKVLIIQFLKSGINGGEKKFIKELRTENSRFKKKDKPAFAKATAGTVEIESFGREGFVDLKKLTPKDFEEAEKAMERWQNEMVGNRWQMIILDEINVAIKFGLIPLKKVINLIKNKPENLELILTGRWASKEIIKLADYVSEIKEIKHPYQKKAVTREGIEY